MSSYINLLAARCMSNIEILLTLAAREPRQMCGIVWSDFGGPLQCIQCSDVKGAFVSWDRLRCGNRLLTLNITLAFFWHFQFLQQNTFSQHLQTALMAEKKQKLWQTRRLLGTKLWEIQIYHIQNLQGSGVVATACWTTAFSFPMAAGQQTA